MSKWFGLLIMVVLRTFWYSSASRSLPPPASAVPAPTEIKPSVVVKAQQTNHGTAEEGTRARVGAVSVVAHPPSVSSLREEARQDPHQTPVSLLRYSLDLGNQMELAKESESAARELLSELKTCALPADLDASPVQARVLCLTSAEELAERWPALQDRVDGIMKSADPAASELISRFRSIVPDGRSG